MKKFAGYTILLILSEILCYSMKMRYSLNVVLFYSTLLILGLVAFVFALIWALDLINSEEDNKTIGDYLNPLFNPIRRAFGFYDSTGYKHSAKQRKLVKEAIAFFGLNEQSSYAYKKDVQTGAAFRRTQIERMTHMSMGNVHTDIIGLAAYIALTTKVPLHKLECLRFIEKYQHYVSYKISKGFTESNPVTETSEVV